MCWRGRDDFGNSCEITLLVSQQKMIFRYYIIFFVILLLRPSSSTETNSLAVLSNDSVVSVQGEVAEPSVISDSSTTALNSTLLPDTEDTFPSNEASLILESDSEALSSKSNRTRLLDEMIDRHQIVINDDTLLFLDTLFHQFQQFINENSTDFQLVSSSDLMATKTESENCRQNLDQLQIQYQAMEKEKSLFEIRLKMVRNDLTVAKIVGEQQKLSVDEEKVDLEHRVKLLQLENSRLQTEILQARKAATIAAKQHQKQQQQQSVPCKCEGEATAATGNPSSSFASLFSTSTGSLPSSKPTPVSRKDEGAASFSGEVRNVTHEDGSIMRTAKTLLPIIYTTINTIFPSAISFIAWEYRLAYRVVDVVKDRAMVVANESTIIASLLDTKSNDSYLNLIKEAYQRELAPSVSEVIKEGEAVYKGYGLDGYLTPVYKLIMTCCYSLMSRLKQYYEEANDVYDMAKWIWQDSEELFHVIGNFIAQNPVIVQALGDSSTIVTKGILLILVFVLMVKLRRVIIGLVLLGVIVALLPLLIALYIGFKLLSFIWPKTKVKKGTKKGKKGVLSQSGSGSQLMPVSQTSMGIGGRAALR